MHGVFREEKHQKYISLHTKDSTTGKSANNDNNTIRSKKDITHPSVIKSSDIETHAWKKHTVLITGDSILNGIEEARMSKNGNIKVRPFSGACIEDMKDYIKPLLKKQPSTVVLHIGTNNAPANTSSEIYHKILELRNQINKELPNAKVVISTPTIRIDQAKASLTVRKITEKLISENIETIDNSNIEANHLGRKGLHLNQRGNTQLAMNFISAFRKMTH